MPAWLSTCWINPLWVSSSTSEVFFFFLIKGHIEHQKQIHSVMFVRFLVSSVTLKAGSSCYWSQNNHWTCIYNKWSLWSQSTTRWQPQPFDCSKHKNAITHFITLIFTDIVIKCSVAVAESHLQHILWALTAKYMFLKALAFQGGRQYALFYRTRLSSSLRVFLQICLKFNYCFCDVWFFMLLKYHWL